MWLITFILIFVGIFLAYLLFAGIAKIIETETGKNTTWLRKDVFRFLIGSISILGGLFLIGILVFAIFKWAFNVVF